MIEVTYSIMMAVVVGVTEVIKRLLPDTLKSRLAPLISLLLGFGVSWLVYGFSKDSVVVGAIIGLTGSGLYSGAKSVIKG